MIKYFSLSAIVLLAVVVLLEQGATGLDLIGNWLSGNFELEPAEAFVFFQLRLPPVLGAVLAGTAFGMAGALFQTQLRNALASPDVLGVSGGASAGVLGALVFDVSIPRWLAAIIGALIAVLIVFAVGWRGAKQLNVLIIVGLAVGYLAVGLTRFLLAKADLNEVGTAYGWLVGSTRLAGYEQIWALAVVVAISAIALSIANRPIQALQLGERGARAIGFRVEGWSLMLLGIAVLLATFATAAVGPLAFVALLAGPIAARLGREGYANLALAALIGSILVLSSDLISQLAFAGLNLPTGLFTGVVGSVFLVRLVLRSVRGDRVV